MVFVLFLWAGLSDVGTMAAPTTVTDPTQPNVMPPSQPTNTFSNFSSSSLLSFLKIEKKYFVNKSRFLLAPSRDYKTISNNDLSFRVIPSVALPA